MNIAQNLKRVRERIKIAALKAQRNVGEIKLVAVSKGIEAESVIEAAKCGIKSFGENYAQEFRDKCDLVEKAVGKKVEWHFIGRLQRNKVKYILDKVKLIHSLDSVSIAEEINKRAEKIETKVPVLIELNTNEEAKGGVKFDQIEDFLLELRRFPQIEVKGLMIMPPFLEIPEMPRSHFRHPRDQGLKLNVRVSSLRELSM